MPGAHQRGDERDRHGDGAWCSDGSHGGFAVGDHARRPSRNSRARPLGSRAVRMPSNHIRPVRPASLYPDVPYDYATVVPAGGLVFTAGACPLDTDGRVVASGDYEAQARQAVANLFVVLEEAGSGPQQVVKTTVYVLSTDRADLVRVWGVVAEAFAPARPPSTLLGVAMLGYPEQLVEIEAVAGAQPA